MFSALVKNLLRWSKSSQRSSRPSGRRLLARVSHRLSVEALEGRCLPSGGGPGPALVHPPEPPSQQLVFTVDDHNQRGYPLPPGKGPVLTGDLRVTAPPALVLPSLNQGPPPSFASTTPPATTPPALTLVPPAAPAPLAP